MLDILKSLFTGIFTLMNFELTFDNLKFRIWYFWAFGLIVGLAFRFLGGGKNE